ncbi:hypothetical protein FACS189437_05820 [Bacteroidia bacterium]|nr:hypothetical protein FACS189437_05820 [Bacteroidia bacterium]
MKKLLILFLPVFALCACYSSGSRPAHGKPLYIKEGEYEEAVNSSAESERRAAAPIVESDYIFRIQPQNSFYYDERSKPLEEPVIRASDYKNTKRLWTRPKRYMKDEGSSQPPPPAETEATPSYSQTGYDWDENN